MIGNIGKGSPAEGNGTDVTGDDETVVDEQQSSGKSCHWAACYSGLRHLLLTFYLIAQSSCTSSPNYDLAPT